MACKPNYELKAQCIAKGVDKLLKQDRTVFMHLIHGDITEAEYTERHKDFVAKSHAYSYEELREADRVNHAAYGRIRKIRKRIEGMLFRSDCVFVTLTFRDDVLNSTSEDTRRKYVVEWLRSVAPYFMANIDYGEKNEREHYHAVVMVKRVDFKSTPWIYGGNKVEHIRYNHKDSTKNAPVRLAKYTSKLTNHAIKASNKRQVVIYSRSDWKTFDNAEMCYDDEESPF